MHDLEITWPEGRARFSPDDSPVAVGRSPEAAVILTDPSISRRHLEFAWLGTSWLATDSSTHGSFDPIGVRLAPSWTVGTDTDVRLGGVEGTEIRIELVTRRPATDGFSPEAPREPTPIDIPPGPPGLDNFSPPVESPTPQTTFGQPMPVVGAASSPSVDRAQPPLPPQQEKSGALSAFDPPVPQPPSPEVEPPSPEPPSPEVEPPSPDAEPPSPPSAFEQAPQAVQPPSPPSAFEQAPPEQEPPAQPPSAFEQPASGPEPPSPPAAFEQGPPPAGEADAPLARPSLFDPPPTPGSSPEGGLFDQAGSAPWTAGGQPQSPPTAHALASQTLISDATIKLSVDGEDFVFLPGTEITVGRDPSCLVALDERHSLVSRRHLKITHRDGNWWIEDYSSKGTFIDGRRLSSPFRVEGAFLAQLGDDDAGTSMRVIAAGEHRAPRSQSMLLLLAVAGLALIAILALVLALRGNSDDEQISVSGGSALQNPVSVATTDLAAAKQSTVLLLADEGLGSGFFITKNLILTNQHVAVLAESLFVAVSREADEPAQVEYQAETLAVHPFLDIAVLRLTVDLDGNPVDDARLPAVNIGESTDLVLGDAVFNTGFPQTLSLISRDDAGEPLLPPVSATSGEAASFAIWPGCSNPDRDEFIPIGSPPGVGCAPDGDVARGIVITTFSSGQGASGSPVFLGNAVVAVVFAGPEDEANAGRNIATSAFQDWLEEILSANS